MFQRFLHDRRASVAPLFVLALVPLIGAVGVSVEYSKAAQLRTSIQAVLDASVLAGIPQTGAAQQTATASAYFSAHASNHWGSLPVATFSVDANGKLTGSATAAAKTAFLGIFGIQSVPISATSAALSGSTSNVCILLTDSTQSQSLLVNSGANLNAPNCEIHVRSTASNAAILNTTLNVKRVCVASNSVLVNGGGTTPVQTNCPAISDPFTNSLPPVSVGACNYNGQTYNPGTVTINPGVYCGWTNFNGSGTVTFNPGLYVVKNGGMQFNSGWTVTGTGVTFYLVDQNATLTFNGGVNFQLSPPSSGTYANILVFEPAGLANTNLPINGTSGSSLQGLVYLPSRNVMINAVSNLTANKVTMVFANLTLNQLNWTVEAANISMTTTSGTQNVRLVQ